jgi:hypothetical protein
LRRAREEGGRFMVKLPCTLTRFDDVWEFEVKVQPRTWRFVMKYANIAPASCRRANYPQTLALMASLPPWGVVIQ